MPCAAVVTDMPYQYPQTMCHSTDDQGNPQSGTACAHPLQQEEGIQPVESPELYHSGLQVKH